MIVSSATCALAACTKKEAPPRPTTDRPSPAEQTKPAKALPSTSSGAATARGPSSPAPAPAPARYVVPAARGAEFYVGHYTDAGEYFEPAEADVDAFEARLESFLRTANDADARSLADELSGYRRQFVGVVREGNRLIFGNFFCSDKPATVPVIVDDGGKCYFNVFYDPRTRSFSKLSINGEG